MQHPFWKRWLSHFKELSLEQTSSYYNPYLEVLLVEGRHQLVTEDAIYSFDDKYINFDQTFKKLNWLKFSNKRVLVLGLGLGSVILLLEKKYDQQMDYTAIEVDPEICRLCSKYTLDSIDSFVEVIPSEAMDFLSTDAEQYDLIIMDIFQSGDIPLKFQSESFISLLKGHLKADGLLLYNRLNITKEHKQENVTFSPIMEAAFPNMTTLEIKDNLMIVSDKDFLKTS